MKTALDAPIEELDKHERNFVSKIREHGWFATHVFGEGDLPGFSYTTGFYLSLGHPEIIVFALKREIAHEVFWNIYRAVAANERVSFNLPTNSVFQNGRAALFEISKDQYDEHLGWSSWFYGHQDFPCIQLVWTDREDRFPWEDGFDVSFKGLQPDLTSKGWLAELVN